jgi:hypothetical protein
MTHVSSRITEIVKKTVEEFLESRSIAVTREDDKPSYIVFNSLLAGSRDNQSLVLPVGDRSLVTFIYEDQSVEVECVMSVDKRSAIRFSSRIMMKPPTETKTKSLEDIIDSRGRVKLGDIEGDAFEFLKFIDKSMRVALDIEEGSRE